MRFTGEFILPTIDINAYKALLKKHLQKELHKVANTWLLGVVGKVPVWSGMSQGSLLSLVELINGTLIITPKSGVKSRIIQGHSLGTVKEKLDLSDFNITIITDVPHYNVQEYTNVGVSKSAPWGSLVAGAETAWPVLKSVRLIAPRLKITKIKI